MPTYMVTATGTPSPVGGPITPRGNAVVSQMKKLLDVTDSRTRLLQQGLGGVAGVLVSLGAISLIAGTAPVLAGIGLTGSALALLVVTAGIKQRWEVEYRGHQIRFENSPLTGERLYLDEGLVAKGGIGAMMELRAPIRVGDGAGETIVALVNAGMLKFRLRLFSEGPELSDGHEAVLVGPGPAATPDYAAAIPAELPVTQSAVFGKLILVKNIFEIIGTVLGILSVVSAGLAWLF